jgi:hypothetical protein
VSYDTCDRDLVTKTSAGNVRVIVLRTAVVQLIFRTPVSFSRRNRLVIGCLEKGLRYTGGAPSNLYSKSMWVGQEVWSLRRSK